MNRKKTYSQGDRPFVLVRVFTFSSLAVMLSATIIIAALNAHWVRNLLLEKSKEYNMLLIENLNHQIFLRFVAPMAIRHGEIKLREKEQRRLLDAVITSTLHSFHVEMVNIYGTDNIIGYSFDPSVIGTADAGGVHYKKAMQKQVSSRLVQKGNFLELMFWFPQETKITTFAPLMQEVRLSKKKDDRVVIGVIEITRDVSDDYKQVFQLQGLIVISCIVVMGGLFLILRYIVKYGERIIEHRAEERLKLEEKLQQAEHLSTIGQMTAAVSHEIRNPLGIIKSSSQLLRKKMEKAGQETRIADIIVEESSRLDHIITDFLNFARPKTPHLRPCRIDSILEKSLEFIESECHDTGIRVKNQFQKNLPEILADQDMIYQVFLNILLNSIQAMDQGGLLTVETSMEEGGNALHIRFMDTGGGISPEQLKKIWTPFYTTKETGTGLGLGIVKNIIQSHNGKIQAGNNADGGAVFDIFLPI